MSIVIELEADGPRVRGLAPAAGSFSPRSPANDGHGDMRKKIVAVVKASEGPSASHWEGGAYLSLSQWLEAGGVDGAILLQPGDDPVTLEGRLGQPSLIAVDFPRIGDGRGYSHAFVLRHRLGYSGRLRALGAVTADQMFALARVGFDSFELRPDQHVEPALAALSTFSVSYQGALVAGDDGTRREAVLAARFRRLERALTHVGTHYGAPSLASSLSAEDMVITDAIARLNLPIRVFTLDTGRLHEETLSLVHTTRARYGIEIDIYRPDAQAVAAYIAAHGANGFYDGVAQRRLCCEIRKVAPLARALEGCDAWITGRRREQASTRLDLPETEREPASAIVKHNPLAEWTWSDVLAYVERFNVPINALHARGYVSIGCEPCSKPIRRGEDPRNGRWWWENEEIKECGLHLKRAP